MEDGAIPANLHYKEANPDIPALTDGRLKVVAERTPWRGGYVGINSFGFGGSNVHVLLKSHNKEKVANHPAAEMPRLVTCSGRTQEAVEEVLNTVTKDTHNVELQALLQENANTAPSTHPYRGYAILNSDNTVQDIQV